MRLLMSIAAGLVGGSIGAAIWAAVAYYSNAEVGIIAWVVGVLVGIGMSTVAGDDRDLMHGAIAAVIALGAIAAGKWGVIHVMVSGITAKVADKVVIDDDRAKMNMTRDLIKEYESKGKTVIWPKGMDADSAEKPEDFPKDAWADASARWGAMPPADRETYKKQLETYVKSEVAGANVQIEKSVFVKSLSPFDLLWAFLAVGSAFRLASGSTRGGD